VDQPANLRTLRQQFADDLRQRAQYWYLSAITFSLRNRLKPLIARHVRGRTLDAGAGGLHARQLLEGHCAAYVSVDLRDRHGELDLVADVQDLRDIPDATFDTVFCSQVLEHLPAPARAVAEFHRVLRPDGRLLVAAPHLSALHEVPHDYFRYTPWGLRTLLEEAGFEIEAEDRAGGLFAFLSHPFSYVLVSIGWQVPVLRWLALGLNALLLVLPAVALDAVTGNARLWPVNVLVVGRRPG
jgi:SAM-dependent methyltransferase